MDIILEIHHLSVGAGDSTVSGQIAVYLALGAGSDGTASRVEAEASLGILA